MLLQEKDWNVFKRWLLPKLETISDADAEVLADYVIALVVADDTEANIRRNCVEQLEDFLQDNTAHFVNGVLEALQDKSYLPRAKAAPIPPPQSAPIPSIVGSSNFEYEPRPAHAPKKPPFGAPRGPAASRAPNALHQATPHDGIHPSRKRKLVEAETGNGGGINRPVKQTVRPGGRNARRGGIDPQNTFPGFAAMPSLANLPPPPPGPLPFDPADPMSFFAMAAAFGANMPGMSPLPFMNVPGNGSHGQGPRDKCTDYHDKGFCALGSFCPYEHEGAIAVPAAEVPEYDPEQSFLAVQPSAGTDRHAAPRGHGHNTKGGRPRAPFSLPGPSHHFSDTTLVVEQIPEAHFTEDNVRGYFSQFGHILEVQMHSHKLLAVLKFADHAAANRAYNCPKAVFENRFVKVYWFKSDTAIGDVAMEDAAEYEEEKLDLEAIAKRQAEAQKAFEERRRKAEEGAAKAAEIEKQLKAKNDEMEKIKRQLAELSGDKADQVTQSLATLQAEAADLFAQHNPNESAGRGRGAFRGGYRGRGYAPFPPRGRGYAPFRGAYRGRGGFAASPLPGRSSVKRLDNRPRRLAIAGIEPDTSRDEALRQHLLNIPDCTSIERHPEQSNTLILTFTERYQAEMFLDESRNIPDVGKLDVSWIPNETLDGIKPTAVTSPSDDDSSATIGEQDIKIEGATDAEQQGSGADADMDVADDVDQWL
ncbi:hypothetical protein EJ02DRAFT_385846 [Clathrospora elynae]|uniref:RNA-binding domain-containing protein n=1 Tax=Clathrospora elynae TaxID=706981 RepID=A0A6A5S9Y1_9PLEO|nr:hypothetical protein EJ02DRAFT_385846 [Clathrospora elynae]